jgi:hypothetical protein
MHRKTIIRILVQAVMTLTAAVAPLSAQEARIALDPATSGISGTATLSIEGPGTVPLSLAAGFSVDGLAVDGRPVAPARSGDAILVPLGAEGRHRVEIAWSGRLPPGEPAAGQVAAEGSYLPGGSGWLPEPRGLPRPWRLEISVPAGQRALATGRLLSEKVGPMGAQASFETVPTEPPSAFAGPWNVEERIRAGVRLRTYLDAGTAALASGYLDAAETILARYSAEIGPYPYDGFAIASAPLPVGLAFPGLTYIHARILPLPFLKSQSLPHEALHAWWGNGIQVGRGGNWAEGLTTYMADHGSADPERQRTLRLEWLRDYAALPETRDAPLRAFRGKGHDADQVTGYGKAAFVFHMLRARIGEAAWSAGIRGFWERHRGGPAGWDDLRSAFEASSGQDLGAFLAQWLERPGAPRLLPPEARAEGTAVVLTLRQVEPAYDLLVPIEVETGTGADAGTERHLVPLGELETTVRIDLADAPRALAVDPGHDLFRRLDRAEAPPILRDVTLAAGAVTVIAAEGRAAEAARSLAGRLLGEAAPTVRTIADAGAAPALVVGTSASVERTLGGPGAVPPELAGRGTARVWAEASGAGAPRLVVMADDAAALEALLRPLPHYGRQGWLVFEGARVIDRGIREPLSTPLRIELR